MAIKSPIIGGAHPTFSVDKTKVIPLYLAIHDAATLYSGEELCFEVYEELGGMVVNRLFTFFNENKFLIPIGSSVDILQMDVDVQLKPNIDKFLSIKGTGVIDYQFRETIKHMLVNTKKKDSAWHEFNVCHVAVFLDVNELRKLMPSTLNPVSSSAASAASSAALSAKAEELVPSFVNSGVLVGSESAHLNPSQASSALPVNAAKPPLAPSKRAPTLSGKYLPIKQQKSFFTSLERARAATTVLPSVPGGSSSFVFANILGSSFIANVGIKQGPSNSAAVESLLEPNLCDELLEEVEGLSKKS